MLNQVQEVAHRNCALNNKQPIIIGVSGGVDSLTLLDILVELEYSLMVAHFNHCLRPEASDDARTVERMAFQMGVPFILGEAATPDYAREHKLSIEEAARELRYHFLFEQAEKHHAQAVVVGHNADDQVETVLMHLLRGAGLDGLTGMPYRSVPNPWSETIPLARPLLNIWRTEIESYCAKCELSPIIDATNVDTTYFRNRLRQELIPELETYVPGFRRRLHQTADLLTADRLVLKDLTNEAWIDLLDDFGSGFVTFNLSTFNFQALGLRRRLIRKAIAHLRPGARDVEFALVQRALNFVAQPTFTKQADLGLGVRIMQEGEHLTISDWDTELPINHYPLITTHYSLSIPGELNLGNGWFLRAEIPLDKESAKRESRENRDPYRAWIDLGDRQPFLNICPRRQGDRFQPLGMDGKSMKISDFMINQKIPKRARAGWPLVCSGDEIVWVSGFRLGHAFRLREKSKRVVKLCLKYFP